MLNIIDDFNCKVLWIEIDTSLPTERVVRVLEMLITQWFEEYNAIRPPDALKSLSSHQFAALPI